MFVHKNKAAARRRTPRVESPDYHSNPAEIARTTRLFTRRSRQPATISARCSLEQAVPFGYVFLSEKPINTH
ncbi:MAG TPA: hypothetical protein PLW35_13100, partial [Verrucomicrobiota bacterium]|nr:hypothetical protein [Verrucomicrobiota bacterium]